MRRFAIIAASAGLLVPLIGTAIAQGTLSAPVVSPPAETRPKNWKPPAEKIYAQALSDQIMARHPELLSVTFHGVPPGTSGVYTMFAGSYPDRIGNPDDPDDIDVITKGITIVDPRWHRTHDATKKFVVQLPLRDSSGENVGLLVLAYRATQESNKSPIEVGFFRRAAVLRDELRPRIASYAALFEPAAPYVGNKKPKD